MKQSDQPDANDSRILIRRAKKKSSDIRAYWTMQRRQSAKPMDMERQPQHDVARPKPNTE